MKPEDIWLIIVYPALLTLIQLLVPQRSRPIYLWLGFVGLCALSLGAALFLTKSTNLAILLVSLSVGLPIVFAGLRFALIPLWHQYHALKSLREILGAVDWGKRSHNLDTYSALENVQTSFAFMGFGFSKYLKATPDHKTISARSDLKNSLLWQRLEAIYLASPNQPLRILMMNPLANEVEKYSRLLKEKYPDRDVEEDLYFSLDCLKEIQRTFGQMVQVRFYPYSLTYRPTFRLFFCNDNDLYLSFYKWGTTGTDLPYLHLQKSTDQTFFLPFHVLFDYLWQHGESADNENMPLTVDLDDIYTNNPQSIDRIQRYIRSQLPPHLREVPFDQLRIAATAIAGRDSALATLQSVESGQYDCIVPILIRTPGKFVSNQGSSSTPGDLGDYEVRSNTIKRLMQVIASRDFGRKKPCYLLNAIFIRTDARSWMDTVSKNEARPFFDTGDPQVDQALMSPCLPCHIYIYYLRAMVCQRLGIKKMIGGDRVSHDQIVKVNQMENVLQAIAAVAKRQFDVEFITPLMTINDGVDIRKGLDAYGLNNVYDVNCVFDGRGTIPAINYQGLDDRVRNLIGQKIETEIVRNLETTLHDLYRSPKSQPDR